MGVMRSMQDWQNLKLIFFMRPSKTKKGHHEEVIGGSLVQEARPNLWQLSTASKMKITFLSVRKLITSLSFGLFLQKLLEETSDDFYKAVNVAIHCINDHKKYYEKVLRNAIKGVGNNEDGQTRVFVTRAEKDLKDIKELYYKKNSVHLEDTMAKENSGYYKKFLLTLLGKGG
ncbi:annexin-like protein RJ4 [Glycine soja]|uniref:annexin-like protein RJ4 n=1 Tax=Glycine soja TaxID=3848 RepID=UPI00103BBD88|nr:annexin-like protein RJ4 [Glycine soja]